MKIGILKMFVLLSIMAAFFTACDNDDDEYYVVNGDTWVSYGSLEKIEGDKVGDWAIRRDDGSRLIAVEGLKIEGKDFKEGTRMYVRYSIIESVRDAEGLEGYMNYYVRLYGYQDVLTKQPVKQSFIAANEAHRQDSIGNDPITVVGAWFGGKYLNVEFAVPVKKNSQEKHFINVVMDDVQSHNDTVYLALRHNAYKDQPAAGESVWGQNYVWTAGNVSFDLTSILSDNATSVSVKLLWKEYKKNSTDVEQKSDSGLFTIAPWTVKSVSNGLNQLPESRKDNDFYDLSCY